MKPGWWTAKLFRIDADHPGSTSPAETVGVKADRTGHVTLDAALPAQAVVLVELTRTG